MTISARIASLLSLCLITSSSANSSELLTMRVSKLDRAFVVVQLSVERNADNRALAPG